MENNRSIVTFSGVNVVNLKVQSVRGKLVLQEEWRVALNIQSLNEETNCAKISHVTQHDDQVLITVIYDTQTFPGFVEFLQTINAGQRINPRCTSIVFFLDYRTGKRMKTAVLDTDHYFSPNLYHTVFAEDGRLTVLTTNWPNSTVTVFSLQEPLVTSSETKKSFSTWLYTKEDDFAISALITTVRQAFLGTVELRSYPAKNSFFKTKLTFDSESVDMGKAAVEEVTMLLKGDMVHYDEEAWLSTVDKYEAFRARQSDQGFLRRLDEAQKIVKEIVDKYPLNEIALSFNGGKDCTVLLQLMRIEVDRKYGAGTAIFGFHITCEDQFPEASQFIIDVASRYNITVFEYPGPLKTGLSLPKQQRPAVTAVFMGSRASDPKGKYMKSPVEWTDSDWPRVLRVCPILNWSYKDVWAVLRGLCVPYCALYDQGYTSLGGRDSTFKNPLLRAVGHDGKERYLPAYMLEDENTERNGRANL